MAYTTINKSTDYFNTKLFTGNSSTNAITGVGFQPDWTWLKSRSGANDHQLYDAVRTATKYLRAESSDAEGTASTGLTSFDSDGFTLGSAGTTNNSGASMASWNWKANGSGSANSDGSITTTATSANTTSGVSLVNYTGNLSSSGNSTVGHGLGVAPQAMLIKSTSNTENWGVYHKDLTANYILQLNSTSAQIDTSSEGTLTAPTSSVFTVNYRGEYGNNGQNYIAYVFAPVQGFSKFGKYTGNGNTDGPFIYTGFKPAFVIIKKSTGSAQDWIMIDNKRGVFNTFGERLYPNLANAEDTSGEYFDFFSNGFKVRDNVALWNNDNSTYIYMAFAAAPLVGTNDIPGNAF
tara:strand:- start:35 stop:1081 length:1047 start_codon:yes stop_codon:yes gene_type:complete